MHIPFPELAPDLGPYDPRGTDTMLNVIPKANGYGPVPSLTVFSEALPDDPVGGISARDDSGRFHTFAGTNAGEIYELGASGSWTARATGLTEPADGQRWVFLNFKPYAIALNPDQAPLYINLEDTAAGFSVIPGSPPKAAYGWVAGDRVFLGNLTDEGSNYVRWCEPNNVEGWEPGIAGADVNIFPAGGSVQGGVGIGKNSLVFQQDRIATLEYTGGDFIFAAGEANPQRGTVAPYSLVQADNRIFYVTTQGFFEGIEGKPIGLDKVDQWFLDRVNLDRLDEVQGVHDPLMECVWWTYDTANNNNEMLGYFYRYGRWARLDVNATDLIAVATAGMGEADIAALYPTHNLVPFPFGSAVWKGGRPMFAAFTTDRKLAFFNGSAAQAKIATNAIALDRNRSSFVRGFEIDTDAANATGRIGYTLRHSGAETFTGSASMNRKGFVPARASGRLHRFDVTIPAGEDWSHISSVTPQGRSAARVG